jgi:hypothetical protein
MQRELGPETEILHTPISVVQRLFVAVKSLDGRVSSESGGKVTRFWGISFRGTEYCLGEGGTHIIGSYCLFQGLKVNLKTTFPTLAMFL